jgi:hypothetical protein
MVRDARLAYSVNSAPAARGTRPAVRGTPHACCPPVRQPPVTRPPVPLARCCVSPNRTRLCLGTRRPY